VVFIAHPNIAARALPALLFVLVALRLAPLPAYGQPRNLTNLWTVMLDGSSGSSPAVAADGTLYLGDWHGTLHAVDPSGQTKWTFTTRREIHSSPAVAADGTVYIGSRDHRLYAVDPQGHQRWQFVTGGWVDSSPAIAADGTLCFGSWDKSFYALKPDGSRAWTFPTEGEIDSSPLIGADGHIYFGSHDGKIYGLTPSGTKAWDFATGGPVICSPAIDDHGTLYFSSVDGWFYALNPDGKLRWRLRTGGITRSSPVIGLDDVLYLGVNGALWAVSADGKKLWERPWTADPVTATPVAFADGSVCFVSRYGMLLNLDAPNQLHWQFYQDGFGDASPNVGPTGTIYTVGLIQNVGYAFYALPTEVPLAKSPWPKFRGNPRNTGNVKDVVR